MVVMSDMTPPAVDDAVMAFEEVEVVVAAVIVVGVGGDNRLECPNVTMDGKRIVTVGSGFNMGVFSSLPTLLL